MVLLSGFDASQIEPSTSFGTIPAGKYTAIITESAARPNKAANGSHLVLTFEIIEGEHKGRRLWSRLNLDNPNEMAVKIAQAELAAICRAVGVLAPRDTVELHNIPLTVQVVCKKRQDTGEITNVIRGYEKREVVTIRSPQARSSTPPGQQSDWE